MISIKLVEKLSSDFTFDCESQVKADKSTAKMSTKMTPSITMIFLTILALCSDPTFSATSSRSRSSKAKCDLKKMDQCAVTVMVFGRRDVYLPVNTKEMVPHCQEEFDAEKCVKDIARKCLKPLPRQLIGVIMLGASQVIKQRCTPAGTQEYLSHYKCIMNTIPELHDCMDQLVVSLEEIAKKPVDQRIPSACCSFSRYISCSTRPVRAQCKDDPTAENYIAVKMIKGYASEVLDLACQGFDMGGEKCSKINLPDGGFNEVNGSLEQYRNVTDRSYSLLPPFIDIFTQQ